MINENNRQSVFDNGELDEQSGFVKFNENNNYTVKLQFLQAEPTKNVNQFKTEGYSFEVCDMDDNTVKPFNITSKRLMRTLGEHRPLENRKLMIHRVGEGMNIDYRVVEVKTQAGQ